MIYYMAMMNYRHLLFIPAYNCEKQIKRVLQGLNQENAGPFELILIIDNVSTDNTVAAALEEISKHELKQKLVLVSNETNVGLGGTHKLAFDFAIKNGFDYVTILHGDDQGRLDDFSDVFRELKGPETFYFGARFHPQSRLVNYSSFRIFGNEVFNCLSSIVAVRRIYDLGGSGLNIFPTRLLKLQPYQAYANDLTFHVYLLLNAMRLRQDIVFVPVSWREDDQISNVKLFRQSMNLIKLLLGYLFSRSLVKQMGNTDQITSFKNWKLKAGNLS